MKNENLAKYENISVERLAFITLHKRCYSGLNGDKTASSTGKQNVVLKLCISIKPILT